MKKYSLFPKWFFVSLMCLTIISCSKDKEVVKEEEEEEIPKDVQKDIAFVDDKIAEFMTKHSIPGLTLAVTKNEKLVYVKAYGFADKEKNEKANTNHLFRVGSVSKPITSIAIFKLIDEGKLTLDAKVFGSGAILGTEFGKAASYSDNLKNITVRHLLNHTAGAWANTPNDPLGMQPSMSNNELFSWVIDNQPVSRAPGTFYSYSNFGYYVLGRIIQKVSGKTYEQYIKDAVLSPIGIKNMKIGSSSFGLKSDLEVKSYISSLSGDVDPYSENMSRIAAAGGWVASAKDLTKLLSYVDGFNNKKDILSSFSITAMTTVPSLSNATQYAAGWTVVPPYWEHFGSIPGGYSVLARNGKDATNVAIIMNKRGEFSIRPDLNRLCWEDIAINSTINWEDIDQF